MWQLLRHSQIENEFTELVSKSFIYVCELSYQKKYKKLTSVATIRHNYKCKRLQTVSGNPLWMFGSIRHCEFSNIVPCRLCGVDQKPINKIKNSRTRTHLHQIRSERTPPPRTIRSWISLWPREIPYKNWSLRFEFIFSSEI